MNKYCGNCGSELKDNQEVCLNCGVLVSNNNNVTVNDGGSFGWFVLGFFFPIVGFILYLCFKNNRNKDAKQVVKGALISVILEIILVFIFGLIFYFSGIHNPIDNNFPDYYGDLKFD